MGLPRVMFFSILVGLSMTIRLPQADPGIPLPQEEVFTDLHKRFERQLDATLEQNEVLSLDAVAELLKDMSILQESHVEISDIRLRGAPRSPKRFPPIFFPQQLLRQAVMLAKKNTYVQRDTELVLARSNFDTIGLRMPERMYYESMSRSLFIHYEKPFERRITFSRRMFLTALRAEYEWQTRRISAKKVPKKLKAKQRAGLQRELMEGMYRPKSLSSIPYSALRRHSANILGDFSRYRAEKRVDEIIAYANIPYGAFCWFYEQRLGRTGYEGPAAGELLALALTSRDTRMSENPAYALIGQYLDGKDSTAIIAEFDIFSPPDERLILGNQDERLRYWKHRAFFFFLREYLGKIYNGIHGNTPDAVALRIRHDLGNLGLPNKERRFNVLFHEPYPEERALFARMKWHGASLVPQ